jgi:hypothetical protein
MHFADWHYTLVMLGHATPSSRMCETDGHDCGMSVWEAVISDGFSPRTEHFTAQYGFAIRAVCHNGEWDMNGSPCERGHWKLMKPQMNPQFVAGQYWPLRDIADDIYKQNNHDEFDESTVNFGYSLYNLFDDPTESNDLTGSKPIIKEYLLQRYEQLRQGRQSTGRDNLPQYTALRNRKDIIEQVLTQAAGNIHENRCPTKAYNMYPYWDDARDVYNSR